MLKWNETATISNLFDSRFGVWPIVIAVKVMEKILTTSGVDIAKENLTR